MQQSGTTELRSSSGRPAGGRDGACREAAFKEGRDVPHRAEINRQPSTPTREAVVLRPEWWAELERSVGRKLR